MWLGLLWMLDNAVAHSPNYGTLSLSAQPGAPDELWANTDGWGLLHSGDGGATWGWLCEESVGTTGIYDVLAWAEGTALVGTTTGLVRVGDGCVGESVAGLDPGFVLRVVRWGEVAAVALIGPESGGIYLCDDAGCVATSLIGAGYYPKSLVVSGDTLWVSLVHTDTLVAELYRTTDGVDFELRHTWPEGDVDPRVVVASDDRVGIWTRPRSDAAVPAFEVSRDGGATFSRTLEVGYYTDPAPGTLILEQGAVVFVGSYYGARTWRSDDGGDSFEEVSAAAPAIRCGLDLGDRALVCTDHLADGYDLAETANGLDFTPTTCLEDVSAAECARAACEPYVDAWVSAGAYGGGGCDPEVEDSAEAPASEDCGCGAGEPAAAAAALAAGALVLRRRRVSAR